MIKSKEVTIDAKKHKVPITEAALSRYLRYGNVVGTISQESVIWLCYRYGIEVEITAKLTRYDEKECLKKIKQLK